MLKRTISLFTFIVMFFGVLSYATTYAQEESPTQEEIVSYDSVVDVQPDNSIVVTETITYDTGSDDRHGIYRDIRTLSSQKWKMKIDTITVADEKGSAYQHEVWSEGNKLRIKIGDPNTTFSGERTYVIRYRASRAVAQFEKFDEIYWNVTGNEWGMPMRQVRASVIIPSGAAAVQSACYVGPQGSTETCEIVRSENGTYVFSAPGGLDAYEGMTVAVGFPKGVVAPYTAAEKRANFFALYWSWFVAALLPLLTFALSFMYWYKKGKDPKGKGVIVPQYDVLDNLTPLEVAAIMNEQVEAKDISAEIIYLATRGYIKIQENEEEVLGLLKKKEYELLRLRGLDDLPQDFDKTLMKGLFETNNIPEAAYQKLAHMVDSGDISKAFGAQTTSQLTDAVKLSRLRNVFHSQVKVIVSQTIAALVRNGYYKNVGSMRSRNGMMFMALLMSVWAAFMFGLPISLFMDINPLPMMAGTFLSVIIFCFFYYFSPAKTHKGVDAKDYLLGLKEYLQIAEKDRLHFHNAPEKKPELFERLLPYAMVLGVAKIWAKEFEGIYVTPPSWYAGSSSGAFSAVAFADTMSDFRSSAGGTLSSSPSGSGGGGSSGGGGGGGGGGSW